MDKGGGFKILGIKVKVICVFRGVRKVVVKCGRLFLFINVFF